MRIPNLELLEYKARQIFSKDPEFKELLERKKKEKPYVHFEFDEIIIFTQNWGSTCTGFDVAEDGSPVLSGQMMTCEYTTVLHEHLTDSYIVCFGDRPCYGTTFANSEFMEDLENRYMASLSEAKKRY